MEAFCARAAAAGLAPRALEARLRRQEILDRADGTAPQLTAVITEASLLYRWGITATGASRSSTWSQ